MVSNAYLSWTWSTLRAVFVLKARPSWVKLKLHEWKRLKGFTVRVLFNQTNKQTNKQNWRILQWSRSEIGTTNARQCQVPVWRDHTTGPRILRKYSHRKYHQQCITIPIYSDIDHSNTQYSSTVTLEVSKKSRFLDANCLSDALAFQKKICGLRRNFFWQQHFARF